MKPHLSTSLSYRPEIDGLRAVAVILIILFHFEIPLLQGGFLGVDIFFVISGYLISKLLLKEFSQTGKIDLAQFYFRRARRILPALFVTVTTVFIAGIFVIGDSHFSKFSNSIIHSLLGLSNIQYYLESNYFDISSKLKPLLHTWSLGVEEQFYLIWPLIILLSAKLKSKINFISLPIIFLCLFLGSLIANYDYQDQKDLIFYMMPFRAFEFVFGALIVLSENKIKCSKEVSFSLISASILIILGSVFIYNPAKSNTLLHMFFVCIGSSLFILFGNTKIYFSNILSSKLFTYIGKLSYSLYLIHWPVYVFFKYLFLRIPNFIELIILFILIHVFARIQYQFIELKFRFRADGSHHPNQSNPLRIYGLAILPVILLNYYLVQGFSLSQQDKIISQETINEDNHKMNTQRDFICWIDDNQITKTDAHGEPICKPNAKVQILTMGNSHEFDSYLTFKELFAKNNNDINITYSSTHMINSSECNFSFNKDNNITTNVDDCKNLETILRDKSKIAYTYDIIILGAYAPLYEKSIFLLDYISELQKINPKLKVLIHGSLASTSYYYCADLINRSRDLNICSKKHYIDFFNTNEKQRIKRKFPQLKFSYLDRVPLFCSTRALESCQFAPDGIPLFFDAHHFNYHGIQTQIKRIRSNENYLKKMKNDLGI